MTFFQRLGYYLGGFSIGLVFLAFFLGGKRASCSYGPSARVKKNISIKKIEYSNPVQEIIQHKKLDSTTVKQIIATGSINFSESDTKKEPCKIYILDGKLNKENYKLTIENCDSIATIKNIQ